MICTVHALPQDEQIKTVSPILIQLKLAYFLESFFRFYFKPAAIDEIT